MDSYEMTVHRIVTTLNGFIEPPVQLKQRTVDKLNSEFRVGAMGVGHELFDLGDSNINMSIISLPKIKPFFTYVLHTALSAHYLNDVFSLVNSNCSRTSQIQIIRILSRRPLASFTLTLNGADILGNYQWAGGRDKVIGNGVDA